VSLHAPTGTRLTADGEGLRESPCPLAKSVYRKALSLTAILLALAVILLAPKQEDCLMLIPACKAKIHRATATQTELSYVGSITIDKALLEASGIQPFQYVNLSNVSNGIYWRTYVMPGKRDSGVICLNGPPARHFQIGDKIIILAEVLIETHEFEHLNPVVIFVDDYNKITKVERHNATQYPLSAVFAASSASPTVVPE
jgi:aspartate 1-decarboxylase